MSADDHRPVVSRSQARRLAIQDGVTVREAVASAHAVGDRVTSAEHCERHAMQTGTVTAVDGPQWTRVAYPDGSYCEGPASAFAAIDQGREQTHTLDEQDGATTEPSLLTRLMVDEMTDRDVRQILARFAELPPNHPFRLPENFAYLKARLDQIMGATTAPQPGMPPLPDGWDSGEFRTPNGAVTYRRASWDDGQRVYADIAFVEVGDIRCSPDAARALAARLIEAAEIVEHLMAGAQ